MAGLAAIQYVPETYDLGAGKMMGRRVAGVSFLEAWIRHSGADPITGYTTTDLRREAFAAHVRTLSPAATIASAQPADTSALVAAGALWIGDPGLARLAWNRRWHRQADWSLVGVTHTLSSHAAMEAVTDLLRAPVQPWDALICTSHAARRMVETLLQSEVEYLQTRLGATRFTAPLLPVIPLGVDCASLAARPADRAAWRAELGLGPEDVAVLQFGRIAHHAKAHPIPLYRALAEAGRRIGTRLHLIQAGQFVNAAQEAQYCALAGQLADKVTTHFVNGARPDAGGVRAAADIGTLMSDNIQETFGLAPVELMSAGLPVVATDWDGLRDTVAHGETGFRVDTQMPPPGAGAALAWRYVNVEDMDMFIAGAAQSTAFDIGQAADAFEALARDPALRARMGAAARERAEATYDWPHVIGAYRALLDELSAIRSEAGRESAPRRGMSPANPAWPDPFTAFAGFATAPIEETARIAIAPDAERVGATEGGPGMSFLNPAVLPPAERMEAILAAIRAEPQSLVSLVPLFPDLDAAQLVRAMGWLLKFGFAVRT